MSDSTAIATIEPECTHPELGVVPPGYADPTSIGYMCTACGKKVYIPASTIIDHRHADEIIAGILGLTFGERWQEELLRVKK